MGGFLLTSDDLHDPLLSYFMKCSCKDITPLKFQNSKDMRNAKTRCNQKSGA